MKRLAILLVLAALPASAQISIKGGGGSSGGSISTPVSVANGGTGNANGDGLLATCTDSVGTDDFACSSTSTPGCPASLAASEPVLFVAGTANTGAATFNYCALGAKALVKTVGGISTALATGDILAKQPVLARYNATDDNWKMISAVSTAASGGGITVGTTTIASGNTTRVPYNNAGVYGELTTLTSDNVNILADVSAVSGGFRTTVATYAYPASLWGPAHFVVGTGNTTTSPGLGFGRGASSTYIDSRQPASGPIDLTIQGRELIVDNYEDLDSDIMRLQSNHVTLYAFGRTGSLGLYRTITAGGTTGAQTINKTAGTVNLAAAATTLVVTNSLVTTSSIVHLTPQTADTTCIAFAAVRAAGSFTITANAACTAETVVGFLVTN